MASLFVIQGRDQGRRFELNKPVLGVGRDTGNAIQLHDTEVSRRHAEVRQSGDEWVLVDLNSSNGAFVNSDRISERVLQSGDRVQVGRTLLIFTGGEEEDVEDLSQIINIVGQSPTETESRIVRSIGQEEGSRILEGELAGENPWLARARSNLQVMYRTALAVSHTLDIDQLLRRIMDLIFEWVEADRGCVMLVDQETEELIPKARRTRRSMGPEERIRISRTILDYVLEKKEGVLTTDAQEDQRWNPAQSILKMGVREAICVPMQGRYGIVGVIYIDTFTPPGRNPQTPGGTRFTEEHLKLMVAIGHQAALAVEDTSYYSAMVQAERLAAIGQTIATLSHHIKNILQGIRGGSYLIEEGLKGNEADVIRKGWGIVEKNQERISNLVLDMLTFSKERKPDLIAADLNETAADVVELMQVRARDHNVELTFRPGANLPPLTFDPEALHRAILNVVTNAIDACEHAELGRVAVTTRYSIDKQIAWVDVEDNGEGIPAEEIKRLFTVFESRKGARGTGLGLPVSQKILREHNGDIRVVSEPGKGSRFRLYFPASPPSDSSKTLPLELP
ncbi:MAG: FHA domain-containing protein [Planctomycetes bacterium]|nr:FHA domain-containing protein [Planctomycetota bacterium]